MSKGDISNDRSSPSQQGSAAASSSDPPLPSYENVLAEGLLQPNQLQELGPDAANAANYNWVPTVPLEGISIHNGPRPPPAQNTAASAAPPDYFDVSVVPEGSVFTRADLQTTGRPFFEPPQSYIAISNSSPRNSAEHAQPSRYQIKSKTNTGDGCVVSYDPLLDKNPDALWTYFLDNLHTPPELAVKIRGYHYETRTRTVTTTNSDGSTSTRTETEQHTVTDFDFSIDVSSFVMKEWSQI
ncbi:hypothetical protein HK102_007232, partial [Quaeritorhiza haematococci]